MNSDTMIKGMIGIVLGMGVCACTGTSVTVNPDPASQQASFTSKCGTIAVKEVPADKVYPPAGNLVPAFATALERSGLAEKVYYPTRPDDKSDMTLDAKFDVVFDPNMGSSMAKSFFTGLTLFLLEPVFWYNFDYNLSGEINVLKAGTKVETLKASSNAEMSVKFLSLKESQSLEGETLKKSKESLFNQLLIALDKYCRK
jgi:hypothetical protein